MIEFDAVTKSYGEQPVLAGVTFDVREGEFVALLGPSGCGKTTTLKLVNRLLEPDGGVVRVAGQSVQERDAIELRRSIGYVFQRFGLFPHLSVRENIGIVLKLAGWEEEKISERVAELSVLVGLDDRELLDRLPSTLSGGQQQRVGLARALAARPRIMLMDEPFGALDPVTRDAIQVQYDALHRQLGLTTLMVTHDMTEALLLADRIIVMDAGTIVQQGPPERLLQQPAAKMVEELLAMPERQLRRLSELRTKATTDG